MSKRNNEMGMEMGMAPFGCCMMKDMKVNIIKTTQPDREDITPDDIKMEITDFQINIRDAHEKMRTMVDDILIDHHKTFRHSPEGFSYVKDGTVIRYGIQMFLSRRPARWEIDRAIKRKERAKFEKRLEKLLENSNASTPSLLEKVFAEYQQYHKNIPASNRNQEFSIYVGDDMSELIRNAKQKGNPIQIKGFLNLSFKDGKPALNVSSYDDNDKERSYIIKNHYYKDTVYELARMLMKFPRI